ncbi:CinA family protein [Novosphingobium sp.]|uniref:CinA family protein n=1 Tax=Novosphingobium sp. TaxID=1874826 RepID=UPI0035B28204
MLNEFNLIAARIAAALKDRREKIAVADGATGGLISASLLTVPGALKFFVGGGIVYSFKARDVMFALPRGAYEGMQSATPEYALLQARAIRERFGVAWGIAESGSAGGSTHPLGVPSGQSCCAVVGPGIERVRVSETHNDDRIANMALFTRNALELLDETLALDQGAISPAFG